MKEDFITEEEEKMILDDCNLKHGESGHLYEKIGQVLLKIQNEMEKLHKERDLQILKVEKICWTNVEIAQLLVAVFNFGEGEWFEIQKRINF